MLKIMEEFWAGRFVQEWYNMTVVGYQEDLEAQTFAFLPHWNPH